MTDVDTSRVSVKTYVPAYQKEAWVEHAERLGMNQSEFVRTMVQAGRRGFTSDSEVELDSPESNEESKSPPPDSREGNADREQPDASLAERIVSSLQQTEYLSWDELLADVTDNVESRLERALQDLQAEGRVVHSGRHDGYVLTDGARN